MRRELVLQLVYISTAREPISVALSEDVLAVSRRNNRADGITGLLVAGKRRFLQAIEGPEDKVRAAFARIAADPRHYACVILSERAVEHTQFGEWAMGYAGAADEGNGDDLKAVVAAMVAPLEDANLRAQFLGFVDIQDAA